MTVRVYLRYIIVFFIAICFSFSVVGQNLSDLIIQSPSFKSWTLKSDPQTYSKGDLFKLINGGADVFFEYGFDNVVTHNFTKEDQSILLEIYEMEDVSSAYGIFSFNKGADSLGEKISDGIVLYDYYLLMWTDRYYVSLSATSNSKTLISILSPTFTNSEG